MGSCEGTGGEQSTMAGPFAHENNSHHLRHRCHFPVSRARSFDGELSSRYCHMPICSDGTKWGEEQQAHMRNPPTEVLLFAWAVLLHKCIGSEVVSFAVIRDSENKDDLALKEHSSYGREGLDRSDVTIVRYQISGDTTLKDVYQLSSEPWRAGVLSREGAFNTAVHISGELSSTNGGQEDAEGYNLSVQWGKCSKDVSQHVRGSLRHPLLEDLREIFEVN